MDRAIDLLSRSLPLLILDHVLKLFLFFFLLRLVGSLLDSHVFALRLKLVRQIYLKNLNDIRAAEVALAHVHVPMNEDLHTAVVADAAVAAVHEYSVSLGFAADEAEALREHGELGLDGGLDGLDGVRLVALLALAHCVTVSIGVEVIVK